MKSASVHTVLRKWQQWHTNLAQHVHHDRGHAVHVSHENLLHNGCQAAQTFFRVHALDAGQHFGKYLASVVLHERGSNSRLRQARLQEVESAFKDAIITRREGHLT